MNPNRFETIPYAYVDIRDLSTSQPYDIFVNLMVPRSEANLDLGQWNAKISRTHLRGIPMLMTYRTEVGNFMTTVTLMSTSNRTLVSSSRAALVPAVERSIFKPFSSSSYMTKVRIPVLESVIPLASIVRAKLEVGRQDAWRTLGLGHGKELAVAEAHLEGIIRLKGLTYVPHTWCFSRQIRAHVGPSQCTSCRIPNPIDNCNLNGVLLHIYIHRLTTLRHLCPVFHSNHSISPC